VRSSKAVDFGTSRKRLCSYRLSNHRFYLSSFRNIAGFLLMLSCCGHHLYRPSCQTAASTTLTFLGSHVFTYCTLCLLHVMTLSYIM